MGSHCALHARANDMRGCACGLLLLSEVSLTDMPDGKHGCLPVEALVTWHGAAMQSEAACAVVLPMCEHSCVPGEKSRRAGRRNLAEGQTGRLQQTPCAAQGWPGVAREVLPAVAADVGSVASAVRELEALTPGMPLLLAAVRSQSHQLVRALPAWSRCIDRPCVDDSSPVALCSVAWPLTAAWRLSAVVWRFSVTPVTLSPAV